MKLQAAPQVEQILLGDTINVLGAVVIVIAGWVLAVWAARGARRGLSRVPRFDQTLTPFVAALVRYGILIATIIAVLERFGVATTSLVAVVGAAGLAIGLAMQGMLSNVAAGVMLLVLRPFRIGDSVVAGGRSGAVREIGLFTTIMIGDDLSWVSVPNASIFSGVIVNNSREPFKHAAFTISIDVASDPDAAESIVMDILKNNKRILGNPPPSTGVATLRENAIDIGVDFTTATRDNQQALYDVQRAIRKRFQEAGISAPIQRMATADAQPESTGAPRLPRGTTH